MTTNTNPEQTARPSVPKLYTTEETAALLSLSPRQVIRARQEGRLGCVRLTGSAVRHSDEQIAAFIAARSTEAVK
jgi:excisionase family DNA binding protein